MNVSNTLKNAKARKKYIPIDLYFSGKRKYSLFFSTIIAPIMIKQKNVNESVRVVDAYTVGEKPIIMPEPIPHIKTDAETID